MNVHMERMDPRSIAGYALGAAVLAGVLLLVRERVTSRAAEARARLSETVRMITAEPESVPSGALYQRFRLRRDGVALMRSDLLRLVAAESAFTVDSGRPTAFPPVTYFVPAKDNVGPVIRLTPNGWWATIQNLHTAITCAVAVGPDTTIGGARPGEPTCWGETAARQRGYAP